jgi:hypothetical protein
LFPNRVDSAAVEKVVGDIFSELKSDIRNRTGHMMQQMLHHIENNNAICSGVGSGISPEEKAFLPEDDPIPLPWMATWANLALLLSV